ncbi:MAG: DUF447 family protein [Methanimicrococcus sp.]|nr:DUF447 family protein [Methanimicrococcus sp.]
MRETAENLEKMAKFGISEGISELILTTRNDAAAGDKLSSNAAPFGIIWKNNRMFLHLFKGSKTCENLTREDFFAANMTDDAVLFATSTFYDLKEEEFENVVYIDEKSASPVTAVIPFLKKADRVVLFKCVERTEAEDSVIIDIEPADFIVLNLEKEGFIVNRGFYSVVEACVHLTRYELTKDRQYLDLIRHHWSLINRCGRKRDKEGFDIVRKRMNEI